MIDADQLTDAIAAWLPAARWCAAKARQIDRLTLADVGIVSGGLRIALVDVAQEGRTDRYLVPVDAAGQDAAGMPALAGQLVATVLAGQSIAGRVGTFAGHPVSADAESDAGEEAAPTEVVPVGVDASNTSLLVRRGATAVIVKLFRRCQAGIQPEVELGVFFARHAPWHATPRLRGWLDYTPAGGGLATTLATVHDCVSGHRSAWDELLALVVDGALRAAPSAAEHRLVLALVDTLGSTTGDMHRLLASRPDLPAFAPEAAAADRMAAVAAALVAHGRAVLEGVAAPPPAIDARFGDRLRALAAATPLLLGRLEAAAHQRTAPLIRVHGDYHLGQVLVARDGAGWNVLVIDFEGEPSRPLEDRRAKASAAKDVAGMCRSFDYLLRCAAAAGGPAYRSADLRLLETRFLQGYAAACDDAWCHRPADAAAVLDAYRLDKALYELSYEIDHRPDWVAVPLAALEAVCTTAG